MSHLSVFRDVFGGGGGGSELRRDEIIGEDRDARAGTVPRDRSQKILDNNIMLD